jgi:hypothetical protein
MMEQIRRILEEKRKRYGVCARVMKRNKQRGANQATERVISKKKIGGEIIQSKVKIERRLREDKNNSQYVAPQIYLIFQPTNMGLSISS